MNKESTNPHGGDIYRASEKYGFKIEDILDFSANINPLGVPDKLREIMVSSMNHLVNYPDPECEYLKAQISVNLDISKENIIVGNGATEILFVLFDSMRPRKVLIPAPTFSEYAKAAKRFGGEIVYFELKEIDGYKLDIDDFIMKMDNGFDAVLLCNPNNPTSTLLKKLDLLRIIDFAKEKGMLVIADEAFIELTEGANSNSMVRFIKEYDNLFIIRAFTKLFAIPGLRLGYGIGNPQLIKKMWEMKMPWSVNLFACCVGEFLSESLEYTKKTSRWIKDEKKWFYNELKQIAQLKAFEPETNFVLIKLLNSKLTASLLYELLALKGILIRDASNFDFLTDKFFRLAIKDRTSNIKLLNALRKVIS